MKTTVLRKMRYQNTFIYVLQFSYIFQYLFSWNGEIYRNEITLRPKLKKHLKYQLGIIKNPYTKEELEEGEKAMLSGAMASIDKIIAEGGATRQARKQKEREIADIEQDIHERSGKPCVWQAIEGGDGFYYHCLTHRAAVKMKDGQKPAHEILSPIQAENIIV